MRCFLYQSITLHLMVIFQSTVKEIEMLFHLFFLSLGAKKYLHRQTKGTSVL